jgi:hypothetical protein
MTLAESIRLIEERFKGVVTGIEYEDGSGKKFNVKINSAARWQFVEIITGNDGKPMVISRWKSVKH